MGRSMCEGCADSLGGALKSSVIWNGLYSPMDGDTLCLSTLQRHLDSKSTERDSSG